MSNNWQLFIDLFQIIGGLDMIDNIYPGQRNNKLHIPKHKIYQTYTYLIQHGIRVEKTKRTHVSYRPHKQQIFSGS